MANHIFVGILGVAVLLIGVWGWWYENHGPSGENPAAASQKTEDTYQKECMSKEKNGEDDLC